MAQLLIRLSRRLLPILLLALLAGPAAAQDNGAQVTWRLLDYIAVDYAGAVQDGRIVSQFEYHEMREFTATVVERLGRLPGNPARAALIADARALEQAVARRAPPEEVARMARALGGRLLAAYPVPLAPPAAPDLALGARVYGEQCASCHGATGLADGPAARGLEPPAIAFADRDRARERSIFALYQVIEQGLEGTAMQSYAALPAEQRWALAFHAGRFAYPPALVEAGRNHWREDARVRARIPNLEALVSITPATLAREFGEDKANAVIAFLRAEPGALTRTDAPQSLGVARTLLGEAQAAYRRGDRDEARELALAAYLDGFEPVEALLSARAGGLVAEVEGEMNGLRAAIARGAPTTEIDDRIARLLALFDRAETALAPEAGGGASAFLGAFAILLREGLEALLIVVAMIGFLKKAERPDMLRYVHIGWAGALAAGAATWWAASHLISISGADREMTEGLGSLLAALVLLFVGIWMHGKAQAGAWQAYVRERLGHALTRSSAWFLFALAFIAVYREVFETIIFFAALGGQGDEAALAGGAAVAVALLALVAWAMLKLSARLPIGKFFAYSAALIAVLAVVLAGKGLAALQEAGFIGVSPIEGGPRSPILGLYPTTETLLGQAAMIVLLAIGFLWARRRPA
ncbi:MAG: FTR1 family protein [Sphingosinicella sp.]|uniref:FTR1 family protein n=1 Tax=Sphingosinicella sp. TaxID=1917971 RepID=UPI004037EAC3